MKLMPIAMDTVVDCGPPPLPKDGSATTPDGTTFNRDAWFACDDGYKLVGSESARCLADGRWSPEPPICRCMLKIYLWTVNSVHAAEIVIAIVDPT